MKIPPPIQTGTRLAPESFDLPVEEIRSGFFSDKYFLYARDVLLGEGDRRNVTMQVFQKKEACLCGVDEAIGQAARPGPGDPPARPAATKRQRAQQIVLTPFF